MQKRGLDRFRLGGGQGDVMKRSFCLRKAFDDRFFAGGKLPNFPYIIPEQKRSAGRKTGKTVVRIKPACND